MMIETEEKSYFDLQNEKDENDIDYYNFFFSDKNTLSLSNNKEKDDDNIFIKSEIKDNNNTKIFEVIPNNNLKKKRKSLNKTDLLKRKAESARKVRQRKKELMNTLIEENLKLKLENKELKRIIYNKICDKCRKELFRESKEKSIGNDNGNVNKNKLFFFSTFSICILILIFLTSNPIQRINQLRNLNSSYEEIFDTKLTNLEIKNLSLASFHVLFGDYYSLVKRKSFLYNENNILYSFKNKGKVRIIRESDIINDLEPKDCEECLVELEQNNVTIKSSGKNGIQFKIILTPRMINNDGKDISINSDFPSFSYEIDCNGYGISKNLIYPN